MKLCVFGLGSFFYHVYVECEAGFVFVEREWIYCYVLGINWFHRKFCFGVVVVDWNGFECVSFV